MEKHKFYVKNDDNLYRVAEAFGMSKEKFFVSAVVVCSKTKRFIYEQGGAHVIVVYNEETCIAYASSNLYLTKDTFEIFILHGIELLEDGSNYEQL